MVKYPSEGGYTPGDTWELYIGSDKRVQQIAYRRSGAEKPPKLILLTLEGYRRAGPLLISTNLHGLADGNPAQVSYSDVAVKLAGSDTWMNAQ